MKKLKILALVLALAAALCMVACGKEIIDGGGGGSEKITVSFNLNYIGAETPPSSKQVRTGSRYGNLPSPSERTGYTFGGWFFTQATAGAPVDSNTPVDDEDDHILWAKWTANTYKAFLDLAGGEITTGGGVYYDQASGRYYKNAVYDSSYGSTGGLKTPIKEETAFDSWYVFDADGNKLIVDNNTPVKTAADHTLYAGWYATKAFWDFSDVNDLAFFTIGYNEGLSGLKTSAEIGITEGQFAGKTWLWKNSGGWTNMRVKITTTIKPGDRIQFTVLITNGSGGTGGPNGAFTAGVARSNYDIYFNNNWDFPFSGTFNWFGNLAWSVAPAAAGKPGITASYEWGSDGWQNSWTEQNVQFFIANPIEGAGGDKQDFNIYITDVTIVRA